jgi:CheY-like chemotaxis protein
LSHALIIEDEFLIVGMIEDALLELGYASFDFATTAGEAIAAAERRCPDLIVADNRLASGTGVEAVRQICADKTIPVVFLTASQPDVRDVLPDAIIVPKPIDMRLLRGGVAQAKEAPFSA